MHRSRPSLRTLRRAVGVVGAGALITLGSAPSAMADGPGTGLVLNTAPIDGVKPGTTFEAPVSFGTTGTKALDKVYLWYYVTKGWTSPTCPRTACGGTSASTTSCRPEPF